MAAPSLRKLTEADYLSLDRSSTAKHEFLLGEVRAMSGASRAHTFITDNLLVALYTRLLGSSCTPMSSNTRVHVPSTRAYLYPDLLVYCGEGKWLDDSFDTLENPLVVIEVLSPSTEKYDRVQKFEQYREIEGLRTYVLVSQDRVLVEVFERAESGSWLFTALTHIENDLVLASLNTQIPLVDIYRRLAFGEV